MWPVYPPHKTQKPTTPSRFVIPLLGGETTHIAPTYEGHPGSSTCRRGVRSSAWELRRAPRVGNEWPGNPCAMKNQRVRGIRADIFFSLPLVTNNRRSNLEKVSVFFWAQLWGFCDFVGIRNAKSVQNSWDECSKLKCAHRQNQTNQLKPPFPLQKQGSFYEPKHCKQFFSDKFLTFAAPFACLCRNKYQSLSIQLGDIEK